MATINLKLTDYTDESIHHRHFHSRVDAHNFILHALTNQIDNSVRWLQDPAHDDMEWKVMEHDNLKDLIQEWYAILQQLTNNQLTLHLDALGIVIEIKESI